MSQKGLQKERENNYPDIIPGKCTALTLQKKNQNRISLFVEGVFVAGFYQKVIFDFKINIGTSISHELLLKMEQEELRQIIRERCFMWLARRAHSRKELKQKALLKQFPKDIIEDVIIEFDNKGYLNDPAFAILFASDKSKLYGWGPQKIRSALYQKGLQKQYIEEALNKAVTPEDVKSNLYKEVKKAKKRFLRIEDSLKRKNKLVGFLNRKGYNLDLILTEMENLLKLIENE
ncbi:MAG: regulatory protein RecX [Balneolales bacterium]